MIPRWLRPIEESIMQRTTRAFVLAVAGFGVAGRISAQPPDPLAPAPRPILETPVNFERAIRDEKLADVLRQLRDKYKCHISVDQAAFDKKGIKSVAEKTVTITKIIGAHPRTGVRNGRPPSGWNHNCEKR